MVNVPVSIGELIDKLSILQVKKIKVSNPDKLVFINKEYELLYNMSSEFLERKDISQIYNDLVNTNLKLWEVEDELRVIESTKNFNDVFIELARQVYYTNDERFRLKDKINNLTNSEVREQKDYKEY
jgi:hypothetical protein